jgi:Head domain of trimeric autotransporter adhesin
MSRVVRNVAAVLALIVLANTVLAPGARGQAPLLEVEKSDATKVLQVGDDGGFVVKGTHQAGTIPAVGRGVRLMWYPRKASLRAGLVGGSEWDDGSVGDVSVALGYKTTASGASATALGSGTTASGGASTALGSETSASGTASTAMGAKTTASGVFSVAMGIETTAGGEAATAMGRRSKATGNRSTAMGEDTMADGPSATAMGTTTVASGERSFAAGHGSKASGLNSTALGEESQAAGGNSLAVGFHTQASGNASLASGTGTIAAGVASVALGSGVTAQGDGSFAFGDRSTSFPVVTGENTFSVRAFGGIGLNTGVFIGCDLPAGQGAWNCTSSRLAKERFEAVDREAVLAKLTSIPIQRWRYLGTSAAHLGPTAEDFYAAFGLGEGPTTIATVDADGVALLGVQALERRTTTLRGQLARVQAENAGLREELAALRERVDQLAGRPTPQRAADR